ncbi:hypothetical protein SEA_ALONE_170 [Streptomyces phage Alone3]|nr:hypothetical protein SEA_ALONE_170 [Streptomyces phage Alone3]
MKGGNMPVPTCPRCRSNRWVVTIKIKGVRYWYCQQCKEAV